MGGTQQLARLAGGLAGLGLAFAAAAPFSGVPPQGGFGATAAAKVEVRALQGGEIVLDPIGVVLESTAFPAPGARGGPSFSVKASNASPVPIRVSLRLVGLTPSLDDAVVVRASGAGAVLFDGGLGEASDWSTPAGVLSSGESTTLRFRLKIRPGLPSDDHAGREDVRQLEVKGVPIVSPSAGTTPTTPVVATSPVPSTPPAPAGTTPAPAGTTP